MADGHVHCWDQITHSVEVEFRKIGPRHVWSPGAGAGAPLSSGSRPELITDLLSSTCECSDIKEFREKLADKLNHQKTFTPDTFYHFVI